MASPYFSRFKALPYSFDPKNVSYFNVINIFERVNFLTPILDNINVYYQYNLKPSDTLETIAYKYYGDVNRFWILMMANNMYDAFYDTPLKDQQFTTYLITKYKTSSDTDDTQVLLRTQSTIDHYEKRMTVTTTAANGYTTSNTTTSYFANTIYSIDDLTKTSTPKSLPTLSGGSVNLSTDNCQLGGNFARVMIYNGGKNYTSAPTLTVTGTTTGVTANVYPVLTNGVITSVFVDNPGSLYTSGKITVSGGNGSGAVLAPFITQIVNIQTTIELDAVSIYDAEYKNNESKRTINIIKNDFVVSLEQQLEKLL